jgi:hypothetical protein
VWVGDNLPSLARSSASHHPGVDYGPEVDANAVIVVSQPHHLAADLVAQLDADCVAAVEVARPQQPARWAACWNRLGPVRPFWDGAASKG